VVQVYGAWVDVAQLRTEEYASNSRIPSGVTIGTPRSDALRRDFTLNALFYNLHTGEIEDLTGMVSCAKQATKRAVMHKCVATHSLTRASANVGIE